MITSIFNLLYNNNINYNTKMNHINSPNAINPSYASSQKEQ